MAKSLRNEEGTATRLQVVSNLRSLGLEPHPDVISVLFEEISYNKLKGKVTYEELTELSKNDEFVNLAKKHAEAEKEGRRTDLVKKMYSFIPQR